MAVIKGGFEIVKRAMLKELMKRGDDGIMLTLPKNEIVDLNARITMDRLIKAGIDPESLTSPDQVLNVLENINNQIINNARVIPGTSAEGKAITEKLFGKKGEVVDMTGKKIDTSQGIMGGKSVKELMESGQVQKGTDDIKISDKITEREMFKNSNLNKKDSVTETISYIKTLEPIDAMKEANLVIGRKGKYKDLTPEQSKKILQDTEDHIFERDIPDEDFATGGRAGYQNGNQVMPAVDPRMQNTYEQNTKLNQIQRNINERVRKGSKTQGLEIGQLGDMYGKKQTEYNLYNPNLKFNEAQSYGAASNMGLRPEQIKAVAYFNTLKNNFGDQGIGMAGPGMGPGMGLAQVGGIAPGTNPFASEKFFKTPAEQFALYQEGLRQQLLQGSPEIYFDADKTYDAGDYVSPKGIYTFRDDEFLRNLYNNNNTMVVDGKEYASEQDAIDDMGIERYNQFMAKGGRAGYYTGGMVDVEPNLSDIGHGSDALMARTRLVAPDSQATTSTGLNYLLAEDNDNIRVPFGNGKRAYDYNSFDHKINELKAHFKRYQKMGGTLPFDIFSEAFAKENFAEGGRIGFKVGGDAGRRAFLKLLATLGGGAAAVKTGILGLGEGVGKKTVTETIKKSAGSGQPPPYFFELMETISKNGKEIKSYGERVKQTVAPSKDGKSELLMTEDLNTGSVQIKKIHKEGDDMVTKSEEMNYTRNMGDESTKGKPVDDYEEITEYNSRIYKDNFNEPDYVEGVDVESIVKEVDVNPQDVGKIKYKPRAEGGRIGFSAGSLAKLGITGSSRRFLEKVFGKEKFARMIENDPELHRGMLEVVEMFRSKDKEGLKMYMQKFLPHMDDEMVEDFIVGGGGTEGIEGQLLRLGSGRDYAGKLEMMQKLNNVKKLENLDVTDEMIRKPNSDGGRIGLFLGGGLTPGKSLLKNMLKFMAKDGSHKKSPAEVLKMMNPKQFQKLLNDPRYMGKVSSEAPEGLDKIIQNMIGKTKTERSDMVGDIISASRNIKKVDDDILKYKLTIIEDMVSKGIDREIAVEAAENLSKEVAKSAGKKSTPKITEQGLLELENIQKNLITKDRKLQAQGGLTTMLGE